MVYIKEQSQIQNGKEYTYKYYYHSVRFSGNENPTGVYLGKVDTPKDELPSKLREKLSGEVSRDKLEKEIETAKEELENGDIPEEPKEEEEAESQGEEQASAKSKGVTKEEKQEIINIIGKNSTGKHGAKFEDIKEDTPYDKDKTQEIVNELLSEGTAYEPRPAHIKLLNPSDAEQEKSNITGSIPEDKKIFFKVGHPVKGNEYYSSDGWKESDVGVYMIGKKKGNKLEYTGDIRKVQAYADSWRGFFYPSEGSVSREDLKNILRDANLYNFFDLRDVYYYYGERVPALQTRGNARNYVENVKDRLEDAGYEVYYNPEIDDKSLYFFT